MIYDESFSSTEGEVPTYPGALTVIRAMRIHLSTGTLTSPVIKDYRWQPGENLAKCAISGGPVGTINRYTGRAEFHIPEPKHPVGSMSCSCGFYAYFSRDDAYHYLPGRGLYEPFITDGCITICSAYGRMTVGDLGVRAQKMKIEAIVVANEMEPTVEPLRPVKPKTVPIKWDLVMVLPMLLVSIANAVWPNNQLISWLLLAAWPLWFTWLGFTIRDHRRLRRYRKAHKLWELEYKKWVADDGLLRNYGRFRIRDQTVRMMREAYPDVPIYFNLKEALEKHPLSGPKDF